MLLRGELRKYAVKIKFSGGRTCFSEIWIFAKFLIGLHLLSIPLQYLNGSHIMYWNMLILNPSRFKVEPHSKYWYFCIERWDLLSLRFSENAVLFHIEWMCRKNAGNVNRPPYCYTAVTHWAHPPSSANFQGDRKRLPKFKFSAKFPIGLHVILQIQTKKSKMTAILGLCEKLFKPKIRRCSTLNPSWNNVKWILFVNYTVIRWLYM